MRNIGPLPLSVVILSLSYIRHHRSLAARLASPSTQLILVGSSPVSTSSRTSPNSHVSFSLFLFFKNGATCTTFLHSRQPWRRPKTQHQRRSRSRWSAVAVLSICLLKTAIRAVVSLRFVAVAPLVSVSLCWPTVSSRCRCRNEIAYGFPQHHLSQPAQLLSPDSSLLLFPPDPAQSQCLESTAESPPSC